MGIVKIIMKVILLPVRICLTIIQLVFMFVIWLSATVFHILSGIICITAILSYGFGQETGTEVLKMLLAGFVLYVLPVLSGWAVVWLETIKISLKEYDPFNEKTELKLQKVLRKMPKKQEKIVFDYITDMSNKCSDLNEFYYRMGLRDGLKLKEAMQAILHQLGRKISIRFGMHPVENE